MRNVISVAAGKGGVLKTTLACHLAVAATERHQRVLLIDGDPQGNTSIDLGYHGDGGASLALALVSASAPEPVRDVRPGLDVVAGGRDLDGASLLMARTASDDTALRRSLQHLGNSYGLIVLDCPARELVIRRAALTASGFVVVPSTSDLASYHGLADLAASITQVRQADNPELDVLAVVAGPIPANGSGMRARATADLGRFIGDESLVTAATIRYSLHTAQQCRTRGLTSLEVAAADKSIEARHLAEDWKRVTDDLLDRHATTPEEPPAAPPRT